MDIDAIEQAARTPQFAGFAQAELDAAKGNPEGAWLSPEAQALNEAEGAARFAKFHRRSALAAIPPTS